MEGPTLESPTLESPTLEGPTLEGPTMEGPTHKVAHVHNRPPSRDEDALYDYNAIGGCMQ